MTVFIGQIAPVLPLLMHRLPFLRPVLLPYTVQMTSYGLSQTQLSRIMALELPCTSHVTVYFTWLVSLVPSFVDVSGPG